MSALPIALPLDSVSDHLVRDTLVRFERGLPVDESVVLDVLRVVVELIDEANEHGEMTYDLYDLVGVIESKEKDRAQAVAEEAKREEERDAALKETEEKLEALRKDLESDHAADMSSACEGMDEMRKRAETAEAKVEALENNALRAGRFWLAQARRDAAKEIVEMCAAYVEKMADGCTDGDATLALRAAAAGVRRDALQVPTARIPLDRSKADEHDEVPTRSRKRKKAT